MMAYRSSIHTVTKYSPNYLVFGPHLKQPIDRMYETRHSELFPTASDYVYNLRIELQKSYLLVSSEMDVEQTRPKTDCDYRASERREKRFVAFTTVKKCQTKKFTSF